MRIAALLLCGMATVTVAAAQTGATRVPFLPIPNTLPTLLFAPDPLAGTLLRPLTHPSADPAALPEVAVIPAALPLAAAPLPADAGETVVSELLDEEPRPAALTTALPEAGSDPLPLPEANSEPEPEEAVSAPEPAPAAPAETAATGSTVTVIVENVETESGSVNVAVCDKDLSREGCPYVRQVPAALGFVETQFQDIPPGTYAIVGYHDVNGNDVFDKTFGMPREPYALSSKAADKLVPTFNDAALPITSGENAIIIRLKRLGG